MQPTILRLAEPQQQPAALSDVEIATRNLLFYPASQIELEQTVNPAALSDVEIATRNLLFYPASQIELEQTVNPAVLSMATDVEMVGVHDSLGKFPQPKI
jgi:hypothetical protein